MNKNIIITFGAAALFYLLAASNLSASCNGFSSVESQGLCGTDYTNPAVGCNATTYTTCSSNDTYSRCGSGSALGFKTYTAQKTKKHCAFSYDLYNCCEENDEDDCFLVTSYQCYEASLGPCSLGPGQTIDLYICRNLPTGGPTYEGDYTFASNCQP